MKVRLPCLLFRVRPLGTTVILARNGCIRVCVCVCMYVRVAGAARKHLRGTSNEHQRVQIFAPPWLHWNAIEQHESPRRWVGTRLWQIFHFQRKELENQTKRVLSPSLRAGPVQQIRLPPYKSNSRHSGQCCSRVRIHPRRLSVCLKFLFCVRGTKRQGFSFCRMTVRRIGDGDDA